MGGSGELLWGFKDDLRLCCRLLDYLFLMGLLLCRMRDMGGKGLTEACWFSAVLLFDMALIEFSSRLGSSLGVNMVEMA